jgi:hypothetical protein
MAGMAAAIAPAITVVSQLTKRNELVELAAAGAGASSVAWLLLFDATRGAAV